MLTGNEIIILTIGDAKKLLLACGFTIDDHANVIHDNVAERVRGQDLGGGCSAHDAAMVVVKLRDTIRNIEGRSVDNWCGETE